MEMWQRILCLVAFLGLSCLPPTLAEQPDYGWDTPTFLDDYINYDDGQYEWSLLRTYRYQGVTVYMVNMTSQMYMDCDYVSCCIWFHHMGIAVPDNIKSLDHAIVWNDGGSQKNDIEDLPGRFSLENLVISRMANDTSTIAAYVHFCPNTRCVFRDDPIQDSRGGDDLIAYSWRLYLDDPAKNPRVILRLPMTKAVVKGMDCVHDFVKTIIPESNITKFGVTGASKRGWNVWSTAAVDRRVELAIPIVFSLLNINQTMMYHYRAMGGAYSFALKDYYNHNITQHFFDPEAEGLYDMEDMIRYRSRLTMPKLLISATGDEFFLNQDNHYWYDMIPEPKWLMMNPNSEHILFPKWLKVYSTMIGFWNNFMEGVPMPVVRWSRRENAGQGHILMHTNPPPKTDANGDYLVRAYKSVTLAGNNRRDYRIFGESPPQLQKIWWRHENETVLNRGQNFLHSVDEVPGEWVAHMIEGEWESYDGFSMYLTTQTNIIPDTYPAEECTTTEECYAYLT